MRPPICCQEAWPIFWRRRDGHFFVMSNQSRAVDSRNKENAAILTSDERKQLRNFDDALADLIDRFLKEGMHPDMIKSALSNHETSDIAARMRELDS